MDQYERRLRGVFMPRREMPSDVYHRKIFIEEFPGDDEDGLSGVPAAWGPSPRPLDPQMAEKVLVAA